MDLKLRQLRYFVAVAEELHFGRAARRLGIAQPPLSQQIAQLERDLGVRLFERTRRRVELTAIGHLFLEQAREALALGERMCSMVTSEDPNGHLRIGYDSAAALQSICPLLKQHRERFPQVQLELVEMLDAREKLDVALLMRHKTPAPFARLRLDVLAVLAADHWLAGLAVIPLARLRHEAFALPSARHWPELHAALAPHFDRRQMNPQVVVHTSGVDSILGFVRAGIAVSLLPLAAAPRGIALRPIDCDVSLELQFVHASGPRTRALTEFVTMACDFCTGRSMLASDSGR